MAQGLWEVHIFAESNDKGLKVRRDAQTAFGVELNTARFNSKLKLTKQAIEIGIDVGVEGRYEVRAILMGTNESGVMQAIASTGSANWLQAGQQSITLKLDAKFIAESVLVAPYALKNVQLINQTYMAFVQTIKSGINIAGFGFNFDFGRKIGFEGELDLR